MNGRGSKGRHVDAIRGLDAADWTLGCVRLGKSRSTPDWGMDLFPWGAYLRLLADLGLTLLALWHTWHPCEPKQTPPTRLYRWFIIIVRLEVIPSAFAWVIASSGTWGSLWLWISCYSWCFPTPRRLGAVEEHWHELVIVRGHLPVIVRGLVPSPAKSQKVTLINCLCHWVTALMGTFLWC
jgi:hypothetical protein